MNTPAAAAVLLAMLVSPLAAQEARLVTTAQGLTFDDPAEVGVESYSMVTSTFLGSHPLTAWLSAGAGVRFAQATMTPTAAARTVDLASLSSTEVFAVVHRGRVQLRGAFAPAVGRTRLSSEDLVLASLAGAEVLPFPARGWGRGNGIALDATVRVGSALELLASVRRHGWYAPLVEDPLEYRLGREVHLGARLSTQPTALSLVEVGLVISRNGADQNTRQDVFDPGTRARLHVAGLFPVARATVLLRGAVYHRGTGSVFEPVETIELVPRSVLGGGIDTEARTVFSAALETRAPAGPVAVIFTAGGRMGQGAGDTRLAWGGLATEVEVRPPAPGRWFIVPSGRIYKGRVTPLRGYESELAAWEASVALHWEGR